MFFANAIMQICEHIIYIAQWCKFYQHKYFLLKNNTECFTWILHECEICRKTSRVSHARYEDTRSSMKYSTRLLKLRKFCRWRKNVCIAVNSVSTIESIWDDGRARTLTGKFSQAWRSELLEKRVAYRSLLPCWIKYKVAARNGTDRLFILFAGRPICTAVCNYRTNHPLWTVGLRVERTRISSSKRYLSETKLLNHKKDDAYILNIIYD